MFVTSFCLFGRLAVAAPVGIFDVNEANQYFIIANNGLQIGEPVNSNNADTQVSNFEIGAIKAPVPSTDEFVRDKPGDDPGSGGPSLDSSQPAIPSNTIPIETGIGGKANVAITAEDGTFDASNVGVYADPDIGIRIAGQPDGNNVKEEDLNKSSNSFFNDPNQFPNTYDPNTQTGTKVNADGDPGPDKLVADQSTRIDADGSPGNAGITFGFDHTSLLLELQEARSVINSLDATSTLMTGSDGEIGADDVDPAVTHTVMLSEGVNIIDIVLPSGKDFLLNNINFVIDGPAGSSAIFRLPGNANMLVENSNILLGDGGIELGSVMFYTDQDENDTHFKFNNMIVNGVAFWSLSDVGGVIHVNNGQGCTQFVADQINLQDVRFNYCEHSPSITPQSEPIPTPAAAGLGFPLLALIGLTRPRRRRSD